MNLSVLRSLIILTVLLGIICAGVADEVQGLSHGPFLGHVGTDAAKVWCRTRSPGTYTLILDEEGTEGRASRFDARSTSENDLCVAWALSGLRSRTEYRFRIERDSQPLAKGEGRFKTSPTDNEPCLVSLGFGSCAFDAVNPRFDEPVWTRMREEKLDAIVLLGDTPYIESTELAVQRRRYQEFYALPQLAAAFREIPTYGVWDDHDFGPNDALGILPHKHRSRRAFVEYHANPSYGTGTEGIYTKFRRGPVEVFLLDTRWFANTERSPVNPDRMTLLGRAQWEWLTEGLKRSTAPIKVLPSGMIWNEAFYPGKNDCWIAYPYERHALFKFLGDQKITGVVLVGGDIHLSRMFVHPTRALIGYDLYEFVSSPLAEQVALYNDIPSPYLRFNAPLEDTFLKLSVERSGVSAKLTAEFLTAKRREPHFRVTLDAAKDLQR
jgi:alkaline phosphatase D